MSSFEFGVWHCEKEDCYVCSDINPFPEGLDFPLSHIMFDDIFQAMKVAEQENERDSETSRTLNQRAYDLEEQVNEKEKWVVETMKRIKEAKKWI